MTSRLFISLEIPEEIIVKLILLRNELYGESFNSVNWEKKEKLHITLKFLGDIENNKIENIKRLLRDAISGIRKFETGFSTFGLFDKFSKPAILWAGIEEDQGIKYLFNKTENALESEGFPKETRKFKPHITLLRIKGNEDLKQIEKFRNYRLPELIFPAEKVVLYKSNLLKSGSVYESLDSFILK